MVNAGLNRSRADRVHVADAVDHQFTGSIVVQSTPLRVVKRLPLGVLRERFLLHLRNESIEFFAQQDHKAVFHITREAHRGKIRGNRRNVAAGVRLGDHGFRW